MKVGRLKRISDIFNSNEMLMTVVKINERERQCQSHCNLQCCSISPYVAASGYLLMTDLPNKFLDF